MELEAIDFTVRGATLGSLLILTSLIWMSRIAREAQFAFTTLAVASCAKIFSHVAENSGASTDYVFVFRILGTLGAFGITWFTLTIFLDDKRFRGFWLMSAVLITVGILITPAWQGLIPYLRGYAVLHFIALMALIVYSGLDDLQDARRRLRPVISAFLLIYAVSQAITSTPLRGLSSPEVALTQSSLFCVFVMIFAIWALKANLSNWPGETLPETPGTPTPQDRTAAQSALVRRILEAMDDGVWQVEGLTVGGLAQKVGAPEHQVRKAINRGLGHRNFASFINRARIDAAIKRLEAPEASEQTILEIAFDVGFSSLGPFNRSFREFTGQSPTDFRKAALINQQAA